MHSGHDFAVLAKRPGTTGKEGGTGPRGSGSEFRYAWAQLAEGLCRRTGDRSHPGSGSIGLRRLGGAGSSAGQAVGL